MALIDWLIVASYCLLITLIGLAFRKRAEGGIEDFFLSGRRLPWWLAGTSLVATSFASDTPLLVTGLVRRHGIAGNWHWWFVALASVASLFFFARLWRRAKIVTDVELIELRYGPGVGAILRGTKALFLGVIFNIYMIGAWPVLGLTKVLEETTHWPKMGAVLFCSGVALVYSMLAGLWGVVAADMVQFIWAMAGAVMLAFFAIRAVGGLESFWGKIQDLPQTSFFPSHTPEDFWNSPLIFLLSLLLVQWWARGIEGDGTAVQRLSACRDEKQSFFAMLWFNMAHYALRPWPWVIVALVSLVLFPEVTDSSGAIDHERAYPRMILHLLPVGFKGFMVASFFASFMAIDGLLNWGSSYVVNDLYRRFLRPDASDRHYVWVGRLTTLLLMIGGGFVAFFTSSIVESFYNVLLLFSGVGLVGVARWFWWRVNAWSEITAMISSGLLTLSASPIARLFGWPDARPIYLVIVVVGSTFLWLTVTFLTKPVPQEHLNLFYERIRPADRAPDSLKLNLWGWCFGVLLVLGTTLLIGKGLLGFWRDAALAGIAAIVGLLGVGRVIRKMRWT